MGALLIWGTATIVYGTFSLWYNSLRRPLTPAEIDGYMERLRTQSGATEERLAPRGRSWMPMTAANSSW